MLGRSSSPAYVRYESAPAGAVEAGVGVDWDAGVNADSAGASERGRSDSSSAMSSPIHETVSSARTPTQAAHSYTLRRRRRAQQ